MRVRSAVLVMLVMLGSIVLAACSAGAANPQVSETSVQAAQNWFGAINAKDLHQVDAAMTGSTANPQASGWSSWPPSEWSTFGDVHCHRVHLRVSGTYVHCSFAESASPSEGNPDTFWTLTMIESPGGRWLVQGYGQP